MPSTKFVVESKIPNTFRTSKVKGMFDIEMKSVRKEYNVEIPIEDGEWNIGLIVGSSGSGKTTIARNCFDGYLFFEGYEWKADSIVDDFNAELKPKQITEVLSKVGFSSPPDWLKPFRVLSNGQKMRAELARLILEENQPVIYDEFTSVVDRQVAMIGSAAIQKFIRKEDKQFIAVSCHHDIEEWLEPDWVYNTDTKEFYRRRLRRPEIQVDIREAKQSEWEIFKEFHYLSATHNNAARKYIAEINGVVVAWCSILHFPHPKAKNIKRLHRTVVRPDYQGIGLGSRLRKEICRMYKAKGFRVRTTCSSPALISSMTRDDEWVMTRKPSRVAETSKAGVLKHSTSTQRLTASFEFVGAVQR